VFLEHSPGGLSAIIGVEEPLKRIGDLRVDLQRILPTAAFAFRGYNTTNLGRTSDLLAHPAYGPIVQHWLERGSDVCAATIGRPVDFGKGVAAAQKVYQEAAS